MGGGGARARRGAGAGGGAPPTPTGRDRAGGGGGAHVVAKRGIGAAVEEELDNVRMAVEGSTVRGRLLKLSGEGGAASEMAARAVGGACTSDAWLMFAPLVSRRSTASM